MSPAESIAEYIADNRRRTHSYNWLGAPRVKSPVTRHLEHSPRVLAENFLFRGIRLDSHEGLVGWLEGRYPLHLLQDMPSSREMLDIQCRGERYVTLFPDPPGVQIQRGRHADAMEFLLHDLEHAHK